MKNTDIAAWIFSLILGSVIILGIIGNAISLMIWTKGKKSSKTACATYFKIIAAMDLFNLLTNGPYKLLQHYSIDVEKYNNFFCKFYVFNEPFGFLVPAWMLIVLSFERMLSICFPLKFLLKGARNRARITFVILTLLIAAAVSRDLYVREIKYKTQQNKTIQWCDYGADAIHVYTYVRKIGIAWCFCILPFILINICNVSILVKMIWRRATQTDRQHARVSVFTKFCIAVGLLHCISTVPTAIFNADVLEMTSNLDMENMHILSELASLCAFLNSSIDFILYFCIGGAFRTDLHELKCKCC